MAVATRRLGSFASFGTGAFRVDLLERSKNGGYGAAMKDGLELRRARVAPTWWRVFHADGQYAPEALPEMIEPAVSAAARPASRLAHRRRGRRSGAGCPSTSMWATRCSI